MNREQFVKEIVPFGEQVYRFAHRMLGDPENAKDTVQVVFCKLWENRSKLDALQSKKGYIFRIAKNTCLDKIKLRKDQTGILNHHKVTQPNYDSSEMLEVTEKLIEFLPEKQRRIIQLRDIEGFSFPEISELLELPLNNIRVSLSIARKKIRSEIQKIYDYGLR